MATNTISIRKRPAAKRSTSSARTAPQTPALPAAPPPTGPQRIPAADRRKPHFVLIADGVDGRYLHNDIGRPALTNIIWDAFIAEDHRTASGIIDLAQANPSLRKLGQLTIQRALVTLDGFITGAESFGSDDTDPTIESRLNLRRFSGSLINTALAQAADVEAMHPDSIVHILTTLSYSVMYSTLIQEYKRNIANPNGLEPDWYLCETAARLFYAGVCAGRREAGQRTRNGQLLMDAADYTEDDVKALTITPRPRPEPPVSSIED